MTLVTLVTPTGHRPEAFALCQKYIDRQTYKGDIQWIIISDDPNIAVPVKSLDTEIYPGPKQWSPGINTQRLNLDAAIPHVKGDYVFIIEDDDWYSPKYIESTLALLQMADVVGEGNTKYYNLKHSCYRELQNYAHSSLCQTAFRRSALPTFEQAVNSGKEFIDIEFWRLARSKMIYTEANLSIGMKGLPGRPGIGLGHRPVDFTADYDMQKLIEWIGEEDAKAYKPFYKSPTLPTAGQRAVIDGVRDVVKQELRGRTVSRKSESFPTGKVPPVVTTSETNGNRIASGPGSTRPAQPTLRR